MKHRLVRHLMSLCRAMVLIPALATCKSSARVEKFAPPGHDEFARAYIASVRSGDYDRGMAALVPQLLKVPAVRDSLVAGVSRLPVGGDSLRLVGANWTWKKSFDGGELRESRLIYEYHAPSGWGLVTVGVVEELGVRFITGFRGQTYARSQSAINDFTFAGKSPVHYFVLLLAIASMVTCFAHAIAAAFTPMPRRWLWALLALVGGSGLVLDWTTGQTRFVLLTINFLGGALTKSGDGPWFLVAAVPLGAMITSARLQKFRRQVAAAPIAKAREIPEQPAPPNVDNNLA
jgi:hypothetical protein